MKVSNLFTYGSIYFFDFIGLRQQPEVESSRTSLASRTHFKVLGLEVSSPWPWPRSLRSLKIALSSARGQHYLLNRWNFVEKRQKPRGKFVKTFFVFLKHRSPEKKFWRPLRLKKNFEDLFFEIAWKKILKTFFLENACAWVLGPWPRALCPRLHLWQQRFEI